MNRLDPLGVVELLAIIEEATSPLRHDVSNRLASVGNMAYFVRRKVSQAALADDPRAAAFLEQISGEVQRTEAGMESWLSRIQALRPGIAQAVAVADCLGLAVEAARLPGPAAVQIAPGPSGLVIVADLEAVAVALRCLIENAAEAQPGARITLAAQACGTQCLLSVVDGGPGIAEPARCLERFYTTKPGHLGLGLCVARSIASRFGGSLAVQPASAGADVGLYFPLAEPTPRPGDET